MKLPVDLRALWERILGWYNAYSERDRRIILAVVALVGLSIVYVGVVEPILDHRKAAAAEIDDGSTRLKNALRQVATKEGLRAERDDLKKRLAQAKTRLLPGGTGTLGAAALQERANALASEKGISVQSTQVMKEEIIEPFRKVGVRLTLSGEIGPLAELVSALEYSQQLVIPFIEVSRRGAVAGAKGPRTLSATVEVNGFVQGGAQPKAEGADGDATPAGEGAPAEGAPDAALVAEGQTPPVPPAAETGPPPAEPGATPTTAGPPTTAGAPGTGPSTTVATSTIPAVTFPQMVIPTTPPVTMPPPPVEPDEVDD